MAQAAFINGSLSFTGFGLTVPPIPSTSITSLMTNITQATPPSVGNCSGDFSTAAPACNLAGLLSAGNFTTTAPAGTVYTYGGYTFTLTNIISIDRSDVLHVNPNGSLGDSLRFTMNGIVSGGAFQPTAFSGEWTAQGSCQGVVGPPVTCTSPATSSWSASLTALGRSTNVPEPATLLLIGAALAGLGYRSRRKAS